jgi:hypothetical protein
LAGDWGGVAPDEFFEAAQATNMLANSERLALIGQAVVIDDGIELVNGTQWAVGGAVWLLDPIAVDAAFAIETTFRLSDLVNRGEGLALTFVNSTVMPQRGDPGGALYFEYGPLFDEQKVSVVLDLWHPDDSQARLAVYDSTARGYGRLEAGYIAQAIVPVLRDEQVHTLSMTYIPSDEPNPQGQLRIFIDGKLSVSADVNLSNRIGAPTARTFMSSATGPWNGAASNNATVHSFRHLAEKVIRDILQPEAATPLAEGTATDAAAVEPPPAVAPANSEAPEPTPAEPENSAVRHDEAARTGPPVDTAIQESEHERESSLAPHNLQVDSTSADEQSESVPTSEPTQHVFMGTADASQPNDSATALASDPKTGVNSDDERSSQTLPETTTREPIGDLDVGFPPERPTSSMFFEAASSIREQPVAIAQPPDPERPLLQSESFDTNSSVLNDTDTTSDEMESEQQDAQSLAFGPDADEHFKAVDESWFIEQSLNADQTVSPIDEGHQILKARESLAGDHHRGAATDGLERTGLLATRHSEAGVGRHDRISDSDVIVFNSGGRRKTSEPESFPTHEQLAVTAITVVVATLVPGLVAQITATFSEDRGPTTTKTGLREFAIRRGSHGKVQDFVEWTSDVVIMEEQLMDVQDSISCAIKRAVVLGGDVSSAFLKVAPVLRSFLTAATITQYDWGATCIGIGYGGLALRGAVLASAAHFPDPPPMLRKALTSESASLSNAAPIRQEATLSEAALFLAYRSSTLTAVLVDAVCRAFESFKRPAELAPASVDSAIASIQQGRGAPFESRERVLNQGSASRKLDDKNAAGPTRGCGARRPTNRPEIGTARHARAAKPIRPAPSVAKAGRFASASVGSRP